ncbi:hypothetical protein K439DRAFT_1647354 [Ramaria rubella]|nr:hypothetical protein K439DRAFT_1647354 [Ramaria rubella]
MSDRSDARNDTRVSNYSAFWDEDKSKESQIGIDNRNTHYEDVVNGYYDGATELYEWGWAQSYHFCRFYKGEAFNAALARHEHYLAAKMQIRSGMRVLDVGCGVGGPARQIARFSDAQIIGLNNNEFQVQRGRKYIERAGLENQVVLVKGDFMKLSEQFGQGSFDAVYAIEATVHAPSFQGVYAEIFKVLKPGGVFGVYEWCMTDTWDPSIPSHKRIAHEIEFGSGIPSMRPVSDAISALKAVGFEVEHAEDLAERPDQVPWYYPLEGDIWKAQTIGDLFTVWRTSWSGRLISHFALQLLEMCGAAPKGTTAVGEALKIAASSLVEGGQKKLFTPMYMCICRKPLEN